MFFWLSLGSPCPHEYQAGAVLRNALFHLPVRALVTAIPWRTFCDPKLALGGCPKERRHNATSSIASTPSFLPTSSGPWRTA